MEMWGIIQIASLVLIILLLYFIWRADAKITRIEKSIEEKKKN